MSSETPEESRNASGEERPASNDTLESADDQRDPESTEETTADLAAQVELLAEENRRLRSEYVRARQNTYRRTALGLFAVGALAILGAVAFPHASEVLFALGGTGLFAGVLTYYLTPEQFVSAETGERVYAAFATTGAELVAELGLQDDRVYAPVHTADDAVADVRLFVPNRSDFTVPDREQLESLFVVTERERERGVSLSPTGAGLYREFESSMVGDLAEQPTDLAGQLADALVEGFDLAESAAAGGEPGGYGESSDGEPTASERERGSARGRVTVAVAGSVYGPVDRFDHPVASFLAVGMAANLDAPVSLDVTPDEDGRADYFVTCEWDPEVAESKDEE